MRLAGIYFSLAILFCNGAHGLQQGEGSGPATSDAFREAIVKDKVDGKRSLLEVLRPLVEASKQSILQSEKVESDLQSVHIPNEAYIEDYGHVARFYGVFDPRRVDGEQFFSLWTYEKKSQAPREFKQMQALAKLADRGLLANFRVAKVFKNTDMQLESEFVEGIFLRDLFTSELIAKSKPVNALYAKYQQAVKKVFKNLEGRFEGDNFWGSNSAGSIQKKWCAEDLGGRQDLHEGIEMNFLKSNRTAFVITPWNVMLDVNTGEFVIVISQ